MPLKDSLVYGRGRRSGLRNQPMDSPSHESTLSATFNPGCGRFSAQLCFGVFALYLVASRCRGELCGRLNELRNPTIT